MNLLELQVLAVVSTMPNGNDARWWEFQIEPAPSHAPPPVAAGENEPARPTDDVITVTQSA